MREFGVVPRKGHINRKGFDLYPLPLRRSWALLRVKFPIDIQPMTVINWDVLSKSGIDRVCVSWGQVLGHDGTLAYEAWPTYDESLLVEDTFNLPVQVTLC